MVNKVAWIIEWLINWMCYQSHKDTHENAGGLAQLSLSHVSDILAIHKI